MTRSFVRTLRQAVALVCLGAAAAACGGAGTYQIGVYYYPGWSPGIKGAREPDTWAAIKRFPEREPLLGWYRDDRRETLDQQLAWMAGHGIDFLVFDWYWEDGRPAKQTSVLAYLASEQRKRVQYALLWANHNKEPRTLQEWDALVDFWLTNHLRNPEYLLVDGKPALYIFSPDVLRDQSRVIGMPVDQLLDRARAKARKAGLAGLYFVLCVPASNYWVKGFAPQAGFDALSAYNYHFEQSGDDAKRGRVSHNFEELDQAYRTQWQWVVKNSKLPYFPPMTSGWDKRPWGGSTVPEHDNSTSTPASFESHLRAAKALMDAHPDQTRRTGVICCWNEYGEGSHIEPSKRDGMKYLEKIQDVFGPR